MRIATWNLERSSPTGWRKWPAQRERMADVGADVWVLTETHLDHSPGPGFEVLPCPEHTTRRPGRERWTAIWSRWPIKLVQEITASPRGTVAGLIQTPLGPLIVYGTVIAWANEKNFDDGTPARMWEVHRSEIERQGTEWATLRAAFPDVPMVGAGDFNQSRDGSRWYGEQRSRDALTASLGEAGLLCVTEEDFVASGRLDDGHSVEHICVSTDVEVHRVNVWPRRNEQGVRLSDHPTIAVDVRW